MQAPFWQSVSDKIQSLVFPYAERAITTAALFAVGFLIASLIRRGIKRTFHGHKIDHTLGFFLGNLAYAIVLSVAVIVSLNRLGVQTTSLIALLSAATFALALSLKNSLSSLAAGIVLIIFRPFKVGDIISVGNFRGTVKEIQLVHTEIVSVENLTTFIPNEKLLGNEVTNHSCQLHQRSSLTLNISYADSFKAAKSLLEELLLKDRRILSKPDKPLVAISGFSANAVALLIEYWTHRDDKKNVELDFWENVGLLFESQKLTVPYPKQEQISR